MTGKRLRIMGRTSVLRIPHFRKCVCSVNPWLAVGSLHGPADKSPSLCVYLRPRPQPPVYWISLITPPCIQVREDHVSIQVLQMRRRYSQSQKSPGLQTQVCPAPKTMDRIWCMNCRTPNRHRTLVPKMTKISTW